MLLNNYYAMLTAAAMGAGSAQIKDLWDIDYPVKVDLADLDLRPGAVLTKVDGGDGVVFGTGNAPPAMDAFNFSGYHIYSTGNNISYVAKEPVYTENGLEYSVTYTITNAYDYALTVGEVGMIRKVYNSDNGGFLYILVECTALDKPISIPPGGVGQVVYTVNLNLPQNK